MTLQDAIQASPTHDATATETTKTRNGETVTVTHHATRWGAPRGMVFHSAAVISRPSLGMIQEDIREGDTYYNNLNWKPA